jgi:hypothetical protein
MTDFKQLWCQVTHFNQSKCQMIELKSDQGNMVQNLKQMRCHVNKFTENEVSGYKTYCKQGNRLHNL